MRGVMADEMVDHTTLYTNDVVEITDVLGIEAGRRAIFQEIRHVLGFDNSYVNYRHMAILCDVMTYKGKLVSINNHGINHVDSGPLQRASFEETLKMFTNAAVFGEVDHLLGVSENIMLGQPLRTGTGAFDVYLDTQMCQEAIDVKTGIDLIDEDFDDSASPLRGMDVPASVVLDGPDAGGFFSPERGELPDSPAVPFNAMGSG